MTLASASLLPVYGEMPKRKADDSDSDDDVEVVEDTGGAGGGGGGGGKKKASTKKAKAADKPPPKLKVIKLKPFTAVEERVAKGASMERNEAIAKFLDGIREAYKQSVRGSRQQRALAHPSRVFFTHQRNKNSPPPPFHVLSPVQADYFKAAAVKKVVDAVRAHKEPFRVAQELGALPGCGAGTVQKVHDWLDTYGKEDASNIAVMHAKAEAEAGKDPEFSWVEDSEKEILLGMLKRGELDLEKVRPWRADISEEDIAAAAE